MKIYHYTTIETLALILKNKTIRFNRLDQVDDVEETMYGSGPDDLIYEKYTFTSCWTKEEQENLALWKMYAGYDGIRIGMNEKMFISYNNEPFNTVESYFQNSMGFYGDDYFAPQINNQIKLYDVMYVDNPKDERIDYATIKNNKRIINTEKVGLIKRKEWEVQKESRFKIHVIPLNPQYLENLNSKSLNTMNRMELTKANFILTPALVKSLDEHYPIKTTSMFISLRQDALENIEVLMGPQTSEADHIITESLLKDYPNAKIEDSYFRGKIRK